jgi:methionine-rich copper-binding protein CopC
MLLKAKALISLPVLAAFSVITFIVVTGAAAHSRPVFLSPGPGAVLTTAPSTVEAWFTAELRRDPNWTFLHVSDAQGTRVDTGETALSADRLKLTATLRPGLPDGAYTVTWRSWDDLSADGGTPVAGGTPSTTAESGGHGGGETENDNAESTGDDDDSGVPGWALVLGVIGGAVVGGAGVRLVGNRV